MVNTTKETQDCQSQESHSFTVSALSALEAAADDCGVDITMYELGELAVRILVPQGLSEGSRISYPQWQRIRMQAISFLESES